jgi:hypothetical protein
MNFIKRYHFILLLLKLALAIPICLFYVSLTDEKDLVSVPTYLWVVVLVYTIIQFIDKQINTEIPSSVSILYYLGLLSIGQPVFLVNRFEKVDWLLVSKI